MPHFRATVRHGHPQQYEMIDVEADSMRDALRAAADQLSEEAAATADLAEIRVQRVPDDRVYGPE